MDAYLLASAFLVLTANSVVVACDAFALKHVVAYA